MDIGEPTVEEPVQIPEEPVLPKSKPAPEPIPVKDPDLVPR